MYKFLILTFIHCVLSQLPIIIQTPNCTYNTLSNFAEECTYNNVIINNYAVICRTALITPNTGCSDTITRYVIFNMYLKPTNGEYVLNYTYTKLYSSNMLFRYINILSDIQIPNTLKNINMKIKDNITLDRIMIEGRVRFLEVKYYLEYLSNTPTVYNPTSEPTLLPTNAGYTYTPTDSPTTLPSTNIPSKVPTNLPSNIPSLSPTIAGYTYEPSSSPIETVSLQSSFELQIGNYGAYQNNTYAWYQLQQGPNISNGIVYINDVIDSNNVITFNLTFNSKLSIFNGLYINNYVKLRYVPVYPISYNITETRMSNNIININLQDFSVYSLVDQSYSGIYYYSYTLYALVNLNYIYMPVESMFTLSIEQNTNGLTNGIIRYKIIQDTNISIGLCNISNILFTNDVISFKLTFINELSSLNGIYTGYYLKIRYGCSYLDCYNVYALYNKGNNIIPYLYDNYMTDYNPYANIIISNLTYVFYINLPYLPMPKQTVFNISLGQEYYELTNNTRLGYRIEYDVNNTALGLTTIDNIIISNNEIQFKLSFSIDLQDFSGIYKGEYYENYQCDTTYNNYCYLIYNLQMVNSYTTVFMPTCSLIGAKTGNTNSAYLNCYDSVINLPQLILPITSSFSMSFNQNNYEFINNTNINYYITQNLYSKQGTATIYNIVLNNNIIRFKLIFNDLTMLNGNYIGNYNIPGYCSSTYCYIISNLQMLNNNISLYSFAGIYVGDNNITTMNFPTMYINLPNVITENSPTIMPTNIPT